MSKKQKDQTITIDHIEHKVADLSEEQISLVNHVFDLDKKVSSCQFSLDQLNVGRNAFMSMLTEAMKVDEKEAEIAEVA